MEFATNEFAESTSGILVSDIYHSGFNVQYVSSPGPEEEEEEESEEGQPPLDNDVVHSPLPAETGGIPN